MSLGSENIQIFTALAVCLKESLSGMNATVYCLQIQEQSVKSNLKLYM